jgi:hypothetical protein
MHTVRAAALSLLCSQTNPAIMSTTTTCTKLLPAASCLQEACQVTTSDAAAASPLHAGGQAIRGLCWCMLLHPVLEP